MTIDTQKLRVLLEQAGTPTLYIRTNRHPETDGRPWGWVSEHPPGGHNTSLQMQWTRGEKSDYRAQLLVGVVNGLPSLLDHIDAQAAEIARLRHALELAEKALLEVEPLTGGGDDEINLEPAILTARAALSGESNAQE